MQSLRACAGVLLLALTFLSTASGYAQQPSFTPDQKQIIDTVKTIFVAAKADDMAKFDSVIAPGFYLYDGGQRFDGEGIMSLMKSQHEKGKHFEWNVTEPDVHVTGNTAWIAYVNQGSITDTSGTIEMKWLESAFLEKRAGVWKIVFMHSTRVPQKQ